MREQKKNNIGMKVLSVLIAVLIWLLVANTNDPVVSKRFSDVPVKITHEDALTDLGYAYEVTEGDKVTITVRGKNSIVSILSPADFEAVADFSKLSDVDAVPIDVTIQKYMDQLEITLGNTNTMKIKRDEIISVSVPVNIVVEGEAADGYAAGKVTGTPNLVKVTGPHNLLVNAKEILAAVDLDGVSKDVTATVKPVLYDDKGGKIDSKQIDFDTSSIDVSIELWKTKSVKVRLGSEGRPADGYQLTSFDYEPKEILIAAPNEILAELNEVALPDVSLDGLTETYEKDIDIEEALLPKNVVLAGDVQDIKIRANIEKTISRSMVFGEKDITVRNAGNKKVTYDGKNRYTITFEGARTTINNLDITDFSPWIDVSGLKKGEHTVAVHVKESEGVSVTRTPEIKIKLKE